jgi:hypothetical protein
MIITAMTNKFKPGPSLYVTIIFCVFTALYTIYIAGHADFGPRKGGSWWYFLKFLLVDSYLFFILQGLIKKSKNWGILLLLPLAILPATIIAGYIMVWIIRWGGGDLLNDDWADMILAAILFLVFCLYSLRWTGPGKKLRKG